MKASYQAVVDDGELKRHGRVLQQVPEARAEVAGPSEVLVVIGRKSVS